MSKSQSNVQEEEDMNDLIDRRLEDPKILEKIGERYLRVEEEGLKELKRRRGELV